MHKSPSARHHARSKSGSASFGWLCCAVVLAAAGCRQGVYTPASLPTRFAARPVVDVQAIDLTKLEGEAIGNETIYPGDMIQVIVATGIETTRPEPWLLRVAGDGLVEVPLIGPVRVAGLSLPAAEDTIRRASIDRQVFRRPAVAVSIASRRVNRVTVTGAVQRPGEYELPVAASHLPAALLAAGGLSEYADRFVEINQPAPTPGSQARAGQAQLASYDRPASPGGGQPLRVDLLEAEVEGQGDIRLTDGAVVNVLPQPDRYIHIIGLASNRTIELPPNRNVHLLDALAQAGGPSYSVWIADRVNVIRKVPNSDETITIKASIHRAKQDGQANVRLAPGDVVSVEENVLTFTLGTIGRMIGVGATATRLAF